MCGSPDVWSSTRNFAGCRSDSSLTPDRQTSRIREITAKGSLDGEPPHSPPSSRGAESNVICSDPDCVPPSLIRCGNTRLACRSAKEKCVASHLQYCSTQRRLTELTLCHPELRRQGEEAAAEKHMAQLQHNMWVTNARSSATTRALPRCTRNVQPESARASANNLIFRSSRDAKAESQDDLPACL